MKGFYEQHREQEDRLYVFQRGKHLFPAHYHQNLEIFLLKKGEYVVTINGKKHRLTGGSVCVFDCYDVHSYDEVLADEVQATVVMIPPKYLSFWTEKRKTRKILSNVVEDRAFLERLEQTYALFYSKNEEIAKSSARLFLAFLDERLEFTNTEQSADDNLFKKLLVFAQENFQDDVSLERVAKTLGYTKPYLSRIFRRYAKTGFPAYVNSLRLEYVEREKATGKNLADVVFSAGFGSLQTYYRVKNQRKSVNG